MADAFTTRYSEMSTGSYDRVDRIVSHAYFSMGHNPGVRPDIATERGMT